MPQARLHVTLPEHVWVGDISRRHPDVRFRVLAALPSDEHTGVGLLQLEGADLPTIVGEIERNDGVSSLDILESSPDSVLVQFTTTEHLLLLTMRDAGIPLELPIVIEGGTAVVDVTAPHEQLSALKTQFEMVGVDFEVAYLYETTSTERLLTDRQEELVAAAIEAGYYDTPRACTLTELAAELEVAKSTLSETLHRAEGRIVKQFGERLTA